MRKYHNVSLQGLELLVTVLLARNRQPLPAVAAGVPHAEVAAGLVTLPSGLLAMVCEAIVRLKVRLGAAGQAGASPCAGRSEEQKLYKIGPQGPQAGLSWQSRLLPGSGLVLASAAPVNVRIGHGGTGTAAGPAPRRSSGLICVHLGAGAP
jgi:hypothetical protein